jgi:hypothetical protein
MGVLQATVWIEGTRPAAFVAPLHAGVAGVGGGSAGGAHRQQGERSGGVEARGAGHRQRPTLTGAELHFRLSCGMPDATAGVGAAACSRRHTADVKREGPDRSLSPRLAAYSFACD